MANKRVSELVSISEVEIATGDLLLLSDVSAIESKKLPISTLVNYLQGELTASASASYSTYAKSASYLIYTGIPNGTASFAISSSFNGSSSHANWADTASHALYAVSASYAKSASYAISCSYSATSSVQLTYSSAYANFAKSASYLIYTGIPNGTASYAILANLANTSKTSSYILYSGVPNGTSSYSIYAPMSGTASYLQYNGYSNGTASYSLISNLSRTSNTASFLQYNQFVSNGTSSNAMTASYALTASHALTGVTSSYALTAGSVSNLYRMYGPFTMAVSGTGQNTASVSFSITSSTGGRQTYFEFVGEASIPITSSNVGRFEPSFNNYTDAQAFGNETVFNVFCQNTATGSVNMPFIYRMLGNHSMLRNDTKWEVIARVYGSASFTSTTLPTRNISLWIFSTADNINLA